MAVIGSNVRADVEATQSDEFNAALYEQYAMANAGSSDRGRLLFFDQRKGNCGLCHAVRGKGGTIGPELSDVGAKLGRSHLIESILIPERQLVEGYRPTIVATRDGLVKTGLAQGERKGSLVLVNDQAEELLIPLDEIEERRVAEGSFMPNDLAAQLTLNEFSDLIAYLESLRSTKQPTPGSGVRGPTSMPPGFQRTVVAEGITGAVALANLPDGRVLICEQQGALRLVRDDRLAVEPVLEVDVDDYWERGLIGVTADPEFARNGYIYIVYVAREPFTHHRISRFTLEGDRAIPGSERILFKGDDQSKSNGHVPAGHQGGGIHFGPDGMLYIGIGEQTDAQESQRLDSILGKILRIAPDGSIPSDNPFINRTQGKYQSIWAIGLRNPFTFAFQEETGLMLINDIGANRFEEVNPGVAGGNYGWPMVEGPSDDAKLVDPVHWYPHNSAAGAAFCPTSAVEGGFPEPYRGKYFFNDYIRGWTRFLDPEDEDRPIPAETFALGLSRPVDLGFSPNGSIYILTRDAWVRDNRFEPSTGALHKIRYVGGIDTSK